LAPFLMAEGQDEGYEDMWDNLNTRGYTRMYYRTKDLDGNPVQPPQRQTAEPAIQAIGIAVQEADADIRATTGRPQPALERPRMRVRSGRALAALQSEGEQSTSVYLDNLATISMYHETRILLDLLGPIYDRAGRVVKILGDEDQERMVMLNQPYTEGPNGPVAHTGPPPVLGRFRQMLGAAGQMMGRPPAPTPNVLHYDLRKPARFTVTITVGKKTDSKRDQNIQAMTAIYAAAPQTVGPTVDLFVGQMDFPGAKQMAERLKKMNPMARDEPSEGAAKALPPEAQAAMAKLSAQNQQLMAAVKKQAADLQTDAVGARRDFVLKQMELASKERIELLKIRRDLAIAELDVKAERALASIDAQIELITTRIDDLQERHLQAMTHSHEAAMAALGPSASAGLPPSPEVPAA